jgi:succinoglycan biosynthesis transport protein ExoP
MSRNATSGLAGGLILGLALALLLGRLDRRIKGVSEAEGMGVTILGVLPRIDGKSTATPAGRGRRRRRRDVDREAPRDGRDLFVHTHPMSAAAECLRTIRTNITFMAADEPMRTMLLTSASPREGKTTVSTNLAISLAQSGKTVLLVDTDMRRPRIHRALADVANTRGVSTVVVGEDTIDDVVVETEIENLFVMPCGPVPPNPSELLHTKGFAQLIEDAKARFDRVIFDSPPLGAVTDAAVLATQVDAVVVVLKAESTTRDALRSTLRQLRDVRANLIGGVINELDTRRNRGYGGGYRYHYYYSRSEGYYTDPSEDDGPDGGPGDGGDGPAPRPGAEAAAT